MPVTLSFFLSLMGAVSLIGGFCLAVFLFFEVKKAKASPRMGIVYGEKEGALGFWVDWDVNTFQIQFYRARIAHWSPEGTVKEGFFTITWDPPQKAPFLQIVELPSVFKELLSGNEIAKRALITVSLRTTDELEITKELSLSKAKSIYFGQKKVKRSLPEKLKNVVPDVPAVMSLCFSELVERRKKLKTLTDQAKAKAAAAKPAAPPKPAAPAPVAAT